MLWIFDLLEHTSQADILTKMGNLFLFCGSLKMDLPLYIFLVNFTNCSLAVAYVTLILQSPLDPTIVGI